MDEYDKQYPVEPTEEEEMYYYQQMQEQGFDPEFAEQLAGMNPQQRAEHIHQLRALAVANGQLDEDFDSEDDMAFFDNNDLANRIWEDNELEQDN